MSYLSIFSFLAMMFSITTKDIAMIILSFIFGKFGDAIWSVMRREMKVAKTPIQRWIWKFPKIILIIVLCFPFILAGFQIYFAFIDTTEVDKEFVTGVVLWSLYAVGFTIYYLYLELSVRIKNRFESVNYQINNVLELKKNKPTD